MVYTTTDDQQIVKQSSGRLIQTVITVGCILLISVALVPALIQLFLDKPLYYPDAQFTLSNLTRLFQDPEVTATFGATAWFCAVLVGLSMVLGVAFAILLGRTDLPMKETLNSILFWPLFLSPQVIGFGAILAYGPSGLITLWFESLTGVRGAWNLYSLSGMAIISAIAATPITTLYCIVAARQQDPNHDAAARVAGASPLRILCRISLPLMRPALIFAFIMNVVHALETLAIPLIIGSPVGIKLLTTMIYEKSMGAGGIPDYGLVAALAFSLMMLVGALFGLQRVMLRRSYRFISIGTRTGAMRVLKLGKWKWPVFALVVIYIVLAVLALVGAVALRSVTFVLSPFAPLMDVLTWQNYYDLLSIDVYRRSIVNTIMLSVIGAATGTILVAAVALVVQRSNYPLRRLLDAFAQLPRVIPGLIVGLGVFYASVYIPFLAPLRNTIWILLFAYLIRFLSSGYGIVSPALIQVTTDFDRAAKSIGAGWTTTMTRIVLPLSKHALLSCFVLLMVLITKEYSSAVFLMAAGSEVIGSTMLSLWLQGQTGPVAALAVLQILATGLMILIATRVLGVKFHD
ncbi:iron(III) transport system permease protein [Xaviernesmea oryzae]|uniref:Iron(III) transport system permease protein n=1 Tax=Xaviernesmea oryzae TaxID=464029 RepID=A0A1X7FRS1_9HYPH|nr:iron ABC transporter permease [Xaviernesmea oryzae]SMF56743.1 iron(III) transport system permease protein [Xaviernesmea oryzae]